MADTRTPLIASRNAAIAVAMQYARLVLTLLSVATIGFAAKTYTDQSIDRRSLILLGAAALGSLVAVVITQFARRRAKTILTIAALTYTALMIGVLAFQFDAERDLFTRGGVAALSLAGLGMFLWSCFLPNGYRRRRHEMFNYYDN